MASYIYLTLDTLAPAGVSLKINNGATFTTSDTVNLSIGCSDTDKTGYQMKIWGINGVADESSAAWETYTASKQVQLAAGDGLKTIHVKLRDDVLNESTEVAATITLSTDVPAVSIQSQDVQRISKVSPKNVCAINWYADSAFTEYKVCVVPTINSSHSDGTVIATTNGSTNTSGSGAFKAEEVMTTKVNGTDFEAAGATANEQSVIKIFVKNEAGTWSV